MIINVGQDGILRPVGNRPLNKSTTPKEPIANRLQDSILPHFAK